MEDLPASDPGLMIEPAALLKNYLGALREFIGAGCVSLYVPASASGGFGWTLLHDGDLSPVPEVEGESATEQLFQRSVDARTDPWPSSPIDLGSADPDCLLVAVPSPDTSFTEYPDSDSDDRRRSPTAAGGGPPVAWLGLRFPPGECPPRGSLVRAPATGADDDIDSGAAVDDPPGWNHLLGLAGLLAKHVSRISSIHNDRTTGLPDRREFQSLLEVAIEKARLNADHLALLWVNPDDFVRINELFGSESGDRVVREIADRLRHLLRAQDLVARYGGVTFAVILRGAPVERARVIANRILKSLSEAAYLDGATRLQFSIGLAMLEPDDERLENSLELVRRADQALSAAKRMDGGTIVSWDERSGAEQLESFDRMAGIFTGDVAKDYRNMMVLWDTVNVIAKNDDLGQLAGQAIGKLFDALKPDGIGLFAADPDGEFALLRGLTRERGEKRTHDRREELAVDSPRLALMRQALEEGLICEALLADQIPDSESVTPTASCYAVPLTAGKEPLGALFLEWKDGSSHLDASDLIFLTGLGLQLTMAWDRVRLVELEFSRQEVEKRQLRSELKQLRQAVQQAKLVYRSPEMEDLMSTARRVAGSDVTILVTGPSGTGKEVIARTIHQLSNRRDKPFVIVDCSAIPTTLIESELFGSERGAYTGAQQSRRGRLAEADRGTVLLDEIGELPLEVQSKFLRFVQEKQFTSVGGSRSRTVDVRILAATNRDLFAEAAAGRFREDLYYRLNVIQLAVPPLKDRPSDILHLAHYFLELYSVQYQRNIQGLSQEAARCLLAYAWPGNVRELQNRIMQAVLLCENQVLTPQDLGLAPHDTEPSAAGGSSRDVHLSHSAELDRLAATAAAPPGAVFGEAWQATPATASKAGRVPAGSVVAEGPPGVGASDVAEPAAIAADLLDQMAGDLGHQITAVTRRDGANPSPIGQWLSDELLLAADRTAAGIRDRGAAILDLAPTTYRRRLEKAQARSAAASEPRPPGWDRVRDSSWRLVELAESPGDIADLPALCERALLAEIVRRFPGQTRIGSALLGVTPPTFRRRAAALQSATGATVV